MLVAYSKISDKIAYEMEEKEITKLLFIEVQRIFTNSDLAYTIRALDIAPFHENPIYEKRKGSKGNPPTIDICFLDNLYPSSFFGFECKIIDQTKPNTLSNYVSKGVKRYLSGDYMGESSEGSMLGYIQNGKNDDIVSEIDKRMKKIPSKSPFMKSYAVDNFNNHFSSKHEIKNYNLVFELHHIFLKFN